MASPIYTYFETPTNWRMNFSALPSLDLSPVKDLSISTSSSKESIINSFIKPVGKKLDNFGQF